MIKSGPLREIAVSAKEFEALRKYINKLEPHEHYDGMNECAQCDESVLCGALRIINKLRAALATTQAEWFKKGQMSIRRKNQSGCCCDLGASGDEIVSLCGLHEAALATARRDERERLVQICLAERDKADKRDPDPPGSTMNADHISGQGWMANWLAKKFRNLTDEG